MSEIIKGKCEATLQLRKLVEMVAKSNSTVLLRGETGCGKSSMLNAILGEMVYMSDELIQNFGGLDKT